MSTKIGLKGRASIVRRTWRVTSARGRVWASLYVVGIEPWSWIEGALVNGDDARGLLGEDDDGNIMVPSLTRAEWWDRRYDWRNPSHWRYWLRSRLTNRVVMLETYR